MPALPKIKPVKEVAWLAILSVPAPILVKGPLPVKVLPDFVVVS
jgi:hypothetical protein